MSAKKKTFPGIFVVIVISFIVYLTVVTCVIMFHYSKPKMNKAEKKLEVSYGHVKNFGKLPDRDLKVFFTPVNDSIA